VCGDLGPAGLAVELGHGCWRPNSRGLIPKRQALPSPLTTTAAALRGRSCAAGPMRTGLSGWRWPQCSAARPAP